jgi:hypothetical protein
MFLLVFVMVLREKEKALLSINYLETAAATFSATKT